MGSHSQTSLEELSSKNTLCPRKRNPLQLNRSPLLQRTSNNWKNDWLRSIPSSTRHTRARNCPRTNTMHSERNRQNSEQKLAITKRTDLNRGPFLLCFLKFLLFSSLFKKVMRQTVFCYLVRHTYFRIFQKKDEWR